MGSESLLFGTQHAVLIAAVTGWALFFLLRGLARSRPNLAIGIPIAVALGVRIAAAAGLSLTSSAATLRGPDERGYFDHAQELGDASFLSVASLDALVGSLQVWLASSQVWLFGEPSELGIRIFQIGLAGAAIALIAAAVYDVAGTRAAAVFAWIMAFEPSNVFFSGLLLKEPAMFLAEGLVALGAVRLWQRQDARAALISLTGVALAMATRPYAGWFLVAAVLAVAVHGSMRRREHPRRLVLATAPIVAVTVLVALTVSPERNREALQASQAANAADSANLSLEPVDFSSWIGIATDLPRRVRDVLLRPYPWQLANASQRAGAIGTAGAWALFAALAIAVTGRARRGIPSTLPLVYPALFLTIAYALATGNAGTGFRYRTHLVVLTVALAAALLARRAPGVRLSAAQSGSPMPARAALSS